MENPHNFSVVFCLNDEGGYRAIDWISTVNHTSQTSNSFTFIYFECFLQERSSQSNQRTSWPFQKQIIAKGYWEFNHPKSTLCTINIIIIENQTSTAWLTIFTLIKFKSIQTFKKITRFLNTRSWTISMIFVWPICWWIKNVSFFKTGLRYLRGTIKCRSHGTCDVK
jgi:hypothetical protein